MSHFSRVLAAAAMAVAAAGSGLLLAVGTAPAYAAAPAAPAALAAAPHGSHTMTISAHLAAPAAGGTAPRTEFPCVVKASPATPSAGTPSAVPNDTTGCLPPEIHCHLDVTAPFGDPGPGWITADSTATCNAQVTQIKLTAAIILSNGAVANTFTDPEPNATRAYAPLHTACNLGNYLTDANMFITWPPGYVLTGGSNPTHVASPLVQINPFDCVIPPPPGGGGGAPCAIPAPSPAGHPAGRQPDVVVCH